MNVWLIATLVSLLLGVSNFIYQLITYENWNVALERSYFQTVAILVFVLLLDWWGK